VVFVTSKSPCGISVFGSILISNKQVPKLPPGDAQIASRGFFDDTCKIDYLWCLWYSVFMNFEHEPTDEELDDRADKLGSYDQAERSLGAKGIHRFSLDESRDESLRSLGNSAERRRKARYSIGPQFGEESLPVLDQRLIPEEAQHQHEQFESKVAPLLNSIKRKLLLERAAELGIPLEALMQAVDIAEQEETT
jgi:hypothetical protein